MNRIKDKFPEHKKSFKTKLEPSLRGTMSPSTTKRFIEFVKNNYEFTPEMEKTQDKIHTLILSK